MSRQVRFHGWRIVAVAFAAQALAIGLTIIPFGLFIEPITREFSADLMTANLGMTLFMSVMILVGPLLGPVLDRHSIRLVMVAGALLLALSFTLMSLTDSLVMLGIYFGVGCAAGTAMLGPLAATTVVAKWFSSKRGKAVGLAAMGPPAGGFLITPLAGALLESAGWRETLHWFAIAVLLIIPFIWKVIRNDPAELNQFPDGGEVAVAEDPLQSQWSNGKILRNRNFWVIALCFGILFGVGGGWNANLPQYTLDLGHTIQQASYLLALGALVGIPGTLLFGALADQLSARLLIWVVLAVQILVYLVLWSGPGFGLLHLVIALLGFTGGGLLPIYAATIGRVFGSIYFGQVMGLAGLVMLPFAALSPPLAGYLRDIGGDYGLTLSLFCACFVGAALVLYLLEEKGG